MSSSSPGPGDRIALLLPGSVAYVETVIGLLSAGIVAVPLDPKLTAEERDGILADVDPVEVVTDVDRLEGLRSSYPMGLPQARPMHVTSGTTGRPKGVWSGLLSEADAQALVAEERDLWGFAAEDVNLVVSPIHHSAPLRFAMGTMLAGGRVVLPGPFDPETITRTIRNERPTTMFCVPAHLLRLFRHWDETEWPDLTSFRLVAHAGAPCPEPVKRRLIEAFPAGTTWEFYGSTEGQFTACRSEEWLERPGTLGRARPGRRMRADAAGVLWCAVPPHARFEYFRAPDKTAAAWSGDEFTVGDLGRVDEDGYVFLDGRREDLIISGGVNVYPAEVENVLSHVPGVDQIAVFARPDDDWGQRVCAAYVGTAAPEDLREHARARLSPAKRPKDIERVVSLPMTTTGKVRRLDLA